MTEARRFPDVSYVLPIKQGAPDADHDLALYLAWLGERLEVIVVDGSPLEVYAENEGRWHNVRHVHPFAELRTRNGKVGGVLTGLALATHDRVIVADDDVRYNDEAIAAVTALLESADVVRPQNYFEPLPWHAAWDSGRSLLNRLMGGDWPGTLALRRSSLPSGYDGDVLFENLELVRTIEAQGGHEVVALDIFVKRRPPELTQFLNQRVRQAYDEFARPGRLIFQLTWLPLQAVLLRHPAALLALYGAVIASAEAGRRRSGGTRVFPAITSVAAPLWFIERSVCAWLAVGSRFLRGGVGYRGGVIRKAASSRTELRERAQAKAGL